jgi:PAS domain S-box-containing protein
LNRLPFAIARALAEKALREKQRAAEEALRESEDRFRRLVEISPEAIFVGCRGQVVFINPAGVKLFGAQDESQVVGKTVADLVHPDFQQVVYNDIEQHEGTDAPVPAEEQRFRRLDGAFVDVEVSAIPLQWKGRASLQVVARDITERKRSEAERTRLTAAIEQSNESVVITNLKGEIEFVNPAFSEITGYSREEVLGGNLRFLKSGKHDQSFYKGLWDTILAGEIWRGEIVNRKKDNSLYTQRTTITPVRDGAGKLANFIAICDDITEYRALEQQLLQAQKMEAVGRLAGGIAHDFNNLLTVIRGYAELMLEESDLGKIRGRAQNIIKASDRTAALTRQLLAFSRKQVLWPQVLDLNAVLAESQKMLPTLIGEDVQVIVIPGPRLGRVKADPGQIEQVLLNLAINARDAMPKGGKLVLETSNVECDQDYCASHPGARPGPYVMLALSDNGSGMDAETQLHIFEPFFTTKPKDKGTGLGLATVYGIVKQSGGHVFVYSEPGVGTTFKVYLPRVDEKAAAAPPPPRFEEKAAVTETILVVEDEESVRHLTRRFLEQRGYRVLEARNGAEALELAAAHAGPIDLLVTDMVMPGMRGHELAGKLSSLRPQMKVLYVSGYTDGSIVENGELAPGSAFLEKPFSSDALARKVRQVLNGAASASESAGPEAAGPAEKGDHVQL